MTWITTHLLRRVRKELEDRDVRRSYELYEYLEKYVRSNPALLEAIASRLRNVLISSNPNHVKLIVSILKYVV